MGYRARVICDSISPADMRLVSVEAEFPRVVLAENVTHRLISDESGVEFLAYARATSKDISKNSASSRAIPVKKVVQKVLEDPYIPERFSRAGAGMQEAGFFEPGDPGYQENVDGWLRARDAMVELAEGMMKRGVHKQDANRLLEPFVWMTQVLTADQLGWNNFFALRCDKHAHPALRKLARMLFLAMRQSQPERLSYGQWHLPYIRPEEKQGFFWHPLAQEKQVIPDLLKFSAARVAWTSYENANQEGTPDKMLGTWSKLVESKPVHSSPTEAQATPPPYPSFLADDCHSCYRSNFRGWLQLRKFIPSEFNPEYNPSEEEIASWGLGD